MNMKIECYSELNAAQLREWREFLTIAKHQHPRQDPRFAELERAVGKPPLFVIGRKKGYICAVGLFTLEPSRFFPKRFSDASALSGPVCDDSTTLGEFLRKASTHSAFARVNILKVTPYWLEKDAQLLTRAFNHAGLICSEENPYRNSGIIDLTRSESELRDSFSRSARRKVRLVEKSEVIIRKLVTLSEAKVFFERLNRLVLKRHNLKIITRPEYEAGFKKVFNNPEAGVIFAAFYGNTFLGGLLLYRSASTAFARRYVADPGAAEVVSKLRVAPSLWLEGMLWAKNHGCTAFDVEGYRLIKDKDDPYFNVYEYKREFNPQPVRRIAEHSLVISKGYHLVDEFPKNLKKATKRHFPRVANWVAKFIPLSFR